MSPSRPSVINIALVGGGKLCQEVLQKTTFDNIQEGVRAPIVAVADPDPDAPGMILARQLGLMTFRDYYELYNPKHKIHLLIILNPEKRVFDDILETRPFDIRVLSHDVFDVFWKAIGSEVRKLRERTEEMETILNGIQDFIVVIQPDRQIVGVNDAFLRHMGLSYEEVVGRKCHEVFLKLDRQVSDCSEVCPMDEVIRNKRPARTVLTRVGPKGEPLYFEMNVYPIWEKEGKISRFIEISRDITERKREEEEITHRLEQMVEERTRQLKETHDKLIHQDKMASLGKLAASVVHEINNPISGILNLTMLLKRILKEGTVDAGEMANFDRYLDLMETETRRISRIVSSLLAFSRQPKIELKRLSVNQLIEHTLFLNANLLKIARVRIEKDLDPDLPDVVGSADQLQQVFMNLMSNAAEVMEPMGGGVLHIGTRHNPTDRKVMVRFADTGTGIPRENISRLFEPFFTTKTHRKGVGLGLSVAYGIIQEHGGSIEVRSTEGKGATFEVELPLEQPGVAHGPEGGSGGRH